MEEFGYEKLEVWQRGMALVETIYSVSASFPKSEQFGLTTQIRRAAISIPSNIAEGYGRGSKPAFANCAKIARGEVYELRTQVEIAYRQKLIHDTENTALRAETNILSRKLDAFIKSLEVGRGR